MAFAVPPFRNSALITSRTICRHYNAIHKNSSFQLKPSHQQILLQRSLFGQPKQVGVRWGRIFVGTFAVGTVLSLAKRRYDEEKLASFRHRARGQEASPKDYLIQDEIPEFKLARSIRNPLDNSKIKFTLYQYQPCPFCCKARAFLDYFGLNYDVIEVNSVTRKQVIFVLKLQVS